MNERRIQVVPLPVIAVLAISIALQLWIASNRPPLPNAATDLPPPPPHQVLQIASFGDPATLARILMLELQSFDSKATNPVPYRNLDYGRLIGWLARIIELDPTAQYPLHAASRIYADVQDEARQRKMLEFVYVSFFNDPERRWPWLAQAAAVAKHRLKDLPLALRYAMAIQKHATSEQVPLWAKQMQAFILEDMNELETARIMIGGFIASGQVKEPGELRFLEDRLKEIESRISKRISPPH